MDELGNVARIKSLITAMKSAGNTDEVIADRMIRSESLPASFKEVFKKAKASGVQTKAVSDFMALPIEQQVLSAEGMKSGTTAELQKFGIPGLKTAAEFTGVGPLGRYLGTKLAGLTPGYQENLRKLEEAGMGKEAELLRTGGVTGRELAGSVVQTGLNVGLPFMGKALTSGTLGARMLKEGALGTGFGASAAAAQGEKDLTGGAVLGGAIGAAFPVAGAGFKALGGIIKTLPARLVNSAIGRSKAEILQDISKDKVDDVANYILKNKPIGTADTLYKESIDNAKLLNNKISSTLDTAERKTGGKTTIGRDNFLDSITKIPEAQGALLGRNEIRAIVERLAPQTKQLLQEPSLTVKQANNLRQLVDKTLGDRAFLGGQLSSDKIILKKFADSLRELVKIKGPPETRGLFSELTNEIRFGNGLLDKIAAKSGNQLLSFGDFIGGGLGGVFGGGFGGAAMGVAARRALESTPFKLGAAKVLGTGIKGASMVGQKLGETGRFLTQPAKEVLKTLKKKSKRIFR